MLIISYSLNLLKYSVNLAENLFDELPQNKEKQDLNN